VIRGASTTAVLAFDLGTSRLKAGLVAHDGSLLALASATYPTRSDGPDRAEQDPAAWWWAVTSTVRDLLAAEPSAVAGIGAICAVGQGPTCVAVDTAGEPTRPAITWQDRRTTDETGAVAAATGLPPWSNGILPAALWIERHEPAVSGRTRAYLTSWEWIARRLAGVAASTLSAGEVPPAPEVIGPLGLPPAKVPPPVFAGSVVGPLRADIAFELGLRSGIPVVAGLNDAFASCLGAGLAEPGDAIDTGGQSGGFAVCTSSEPDVAGAWIAPAPIDGLWLVGGAMSATGLALDWLAASVLGGGFAVQSLLEEAAGVPPGADGVVFLPYLAGERSPLWDPKARGAFVGLTSAHGRAHLVRAVLEAAAFAVRHVAEPIRAAGYEVASVRVCGGNARSRLWNQVKADVLGVPVLVPAEPNTAVLGAAILGVVGMGATASPRAAIDAMVRTSTRLEPDPSTRAAYDAGYAIYRSLYPALREPMHALTALSDSPDEARQPS
jgi:xylulokinase